MHRIGAGAWVGLGLLALACLTTPALPAGQPTAATPTAGLPAPEAPPTARLQPDDFTYLGAFRLPQGGDRPVTFAYGGAAMTYNPGGDGDGPSDGFPGSLFITGHDRLPYGELPDGDQVAEIEIPAPQVADDLSRLNTAGFLQSFHEVTAGRFPGLDEIPRVALLYLDTPLTGPLVHLAFGQHLEPDPPVASHAWFGTDLANPETAGAWYLAGASPYSINGYMLEIPQAWADEYVDGRVIGTGRFRDGGWSGMGPSLYAYRPWQDDGGAPAPGSVLEATPLLQYPSSDATDEVTVGLAGYQHPDEWEGGAWLTTSSGGSAVLFAGTKAIGDRYWYGYLDSGDPSRPCIDAAFLGEFTVCRTAEAAPCATAEQVECAQHGEFRGWWSSQFAAQFMLYDPQDLARVARGESEPWQPQPYASLDVDDHLYHNPDAVEIQMLGSGEQRRFRLGEIAFDRSNGLLYVLELYADGAQPVVHVWRVG